MRTNSTDGALHASARNFFVLTSLIACATGCDVLLDWQPEPPAKILLIVVDTLRRDHVSVYGDRARTPNIDAVAAEGQAIEGALASFHQTTLSMGALFSGRTPSREANDGGGPMFLGGRSLCGLVRFFDAGREPGCIPASVSTLAERLREAGYQTVGVVTNPLLFRPAGFDRGFDRWTELPGEPAAGPGRLRAPAASDVTQLAITQAAAQPEGRTFLYVHYMDAHDYALWDLTYRESVERADAAIGALIRDLDRTGWLANGLVIITSDHGQRLSESHLLPGTPGHLGNPSFEELLKIPIVVRPAILPRGEDSPMRSEDLFRLITTAAGLQDLPRSDLAPDELFLTETRFRTYRRGQWKSFWNRADDRIALVDLATDPHETRDESNQHPEIVAEHRARMAELARSLAGARNLQRGPTALERERLEALGYLEESRMQDETQ